MPSFLPEQVRILHPAAHLMNEIAEFLAMSIYSFMTYEWIGKSPIVYANMGKCPVSFMVKIKIKIKDL